MFFRVVALKSSKSAAFLFFVSNMYMRSEFDALCPYNAMRADPLEQLNLLTRSSGMSRRDIRPDLQSIANRFMQSLSSAVKYISPSARLHSTDWTEGLKSRVIGRTVFFATSIR